MFLAPSPWNKVSFMSFSHIWTPKRLEWSAHKKYLINIWITNELLLNKKNITLSEMWMIFLYVSHKKIKVAASVSILRKIKLQKMFGCQSCLAFSCPFPWTHLLKCQIYFINLSSQNSSTLKAWRLSEQKIFLHDNELAILRVSDFKPFVKEMQLSSHHLLQQGKWLCCSMRWGS